jgi:hypothetical protein
MFMTQKNTLFTQPVHAALLTRRMLMGAGIALALMSIFLLGVKDPDPQWGKLWMIRPLIVISLAGAGGAAFYHFTGPLRQQGGWIMFGTYLLNAFAFLVALWMGSVVGLDGTLWD